MQLSDFDFVLPEDLIAQHPLASRSASRLLDARQGLADRRISDLPQLLNAGDLLIFNDTKVIKARMFATKETGGQIEIMVDRLVDDHHVLALIRASKAPKAGAVLTLRSGRTWSVVKRTDDLYLLHTAENSYEVLEADGLLPLPPYIEHAANAQDEQRYQTVYAREPGAVAAPTAGLHFDDALLAALDAHGVKRSFLTLHVGAGTFLPVRHEDLSQHVMHAEQYRITDQLREDIALARARGGRIIAVGTTALRALESAADGQGGVRVGAGETRLFITPGYRFQVVESLVTNFHLPKSTLLMLVSAFSGLERIREAYRHAIAARYRFFSYGDAMLLNRL